MPNTLPDALRADVFAALDVVSRELVGAIPGVTRNASADRLALGQNLRWSQAPAATTSNYTPAMAVPTAIDQTISNGAINITKNKFSGFSWTGEEIAQMDSGIGFLNIQQDQIAQSIRALVNEMEADVCDALALGASRAFGTAGTTPFASTLADSAQVRKILDDNGAPASGRSLVINTSAGAALRTLQNLTRVSEAGDSMTLRDGEILNIHGFSIRESAQINDNTAGTGASYLLNGALAIGATTVTVDTGSGTILAGDIVTIGGQKYVAATALSGATFTIASPGIQVATADNAAITVNATSARNIAFTPDSVVLATRLPYMPPNGDMATASEIVTDSRTGISFDLRQYPGDGMMLYRLHALWGVKVVKPNNVALLLG